MPDLVTTTVLMPGEYLFSDQYSRIQTLLGSCVAMVFWHPQKRIGCMGHIVLPSRHFSTGLDARYVDEFMTILMKEIRLRGTAPEAYEARLYGAANMFKAIKSTCADAGDHPDKRCEGCINVSCRNRLAVLGETRNYGFRIAELDLGGTGYRHVDFNIADGTTAVRTMPVVAMTDLMDGVAV